MEEKPRILIVDDDESTCRSLALIFARTGYESAAAHTGQEAIRRAQESFFNLALLDINLPDMAGIELLTPLKALHPDIGLIMVTGYASLETAMRAVNEGAMAYITKPINVEETLAMIRGALEKQRLVVENRRLYQAAQQELAERKRAEEALQRRTRELDMLNRATQALTSNLDLDQVIVNVLEEVRRLLGVVACSIWLVSPGEDDLVCRQAIGPQSEMVCGWRLPVGEGFVGLAASSGESLLVSDAVADRRHYLGVDQQTGLMLRSIVSIPLRVKQRVIGVLQVMDTQPDRFDETHLTLLEPLAASAAIAIDNARLVETLRQQAVELQKRNEELDAFAHTAAHDLKGPLGYMVGFARVLEQEHDTMTGDDLRRYLSKIARSGQKMSNLIDELLLLATARKLEEVDLHPLDMAEVVGAALQRLEYMIDELHAEVILPDDWPAALGYGPWVEEVWVNYISNALKYGGKPPRVELGSGEWANSRMDESTNGRTEAGAPIRKFADSPIRFWVRDNGAGLTSEEQARLFTPFTRLDQVRVRGHGLGLSIVRRIVEKLGGEVGIESEVGQGSVFSFTLPAVK